MKKSVVWLSLSTLMALSLVIAACAPAAIQEATTPVSTPPSTTPPATTSPTAVPPVAEPPQTGQQPQSDDKPQYGGTLTMGLTADVTTFAGIENC